LLGLIDPTAVGLEVAAVVAAEGLASVVALLVGSEAAAVAVEGNPEEGLLAYVVIQIIQSLGELVDAAFEPFQAAKLVVVAAGVEIAAVAVVVVAVVVVVC
jgi:hypothetical protein